MIYEEKPPCPQEKTSSNLSNPSGDVQRDRPNQYQHSGLGLDSLARSKPVKPEEEHQI